MNTKIQAWDGWAPARKFDDGEQARKREHQLFLMSTGTLATAQLPFWLNWLRANRPRYDIQAGLTDSARQFVSPTAIAALTGSPPRGNDWRSDDREYLLPVHNNIAHDYDAILVYPASVAFLGAVASGSASTPFTLAALGARVPVVITPTFPPGVAENPIVRQILERLRSVPNYHLIKPHKGKSRSIDSETDVAAPLWEVIAVLESACDSTGRPASEDRSSETAQSVGTR